MQYHAQIVLAYPSHREQDRRMRGSIRKTDFTWDPRRESRRDVWNRFQQHLEAELDRIEAATRPHDRAVVADHAVSGGGVPSDRPSADTTCEPGSADLTNGAVS
jgi:hypothetical protein